MINSARNVQYNGEQLLDCNIKPGMTIETVVKIMAAAIELVHSNQSLDCLKLADFGIDCIPEDANTICFLLEKLLNDQITLSQRLAQINGFYGNVKESVGVITDEKVKVTKDSATSKYLAEAIDGTPNRIKTKDDKVVVTGLLPVGSRMVINPNRIKDFGSDGKGKAGTDLEGWAIRDGRNGLDNALGRFPMYADAIENVGKKAGNASATIKLSNIESFQLSVTGDIKEALTSPIKVKIPLNTKNKCFGISKCMNVLIPDTNAPIMAESEPLNLNHTHTFTLNGSHTNPTPEPIALNPEHIKELPIEFIGL